MSHTHGALAERMGITVSAASADLVVGAMQVAGNTQYAGALHGGASAAFAETLGGVGAQLHATSIGRRAVGVSLTVHHHRGVDAARVSEVTGRAVATHLGRRIADYRIEITNGDILVASGLLTCAIIE